jgi:hypothetical protein
MTEALDEARRAAADRREGWREAGKSLTRKRVVCTRACQVITRRREWSRVTPAGPAGHLARSHVPSPFLTACLTCMMIGEQAAQIVAEALRAPGGAAASPT